MSVGKTGLALLSLMLIATPLVVDPAGAQERPALPDGGMELSSEDRDALTAYVWSLANGTHLPER